MSAMFCARQAPGGGSPWYQWMEHQRAAGRYDFQYGSRVFEYTDSFAPRGWKQYDTVSQVELRRIFENMSLDFQTDQVPLDCMGWTYYVKFDIFHTNPQDFHSAPADAIGFQLSGHEASRNTKRWIRLVTFLGRA